MKITFIYNSEEVVQDSLPYTKVRKSIKRVPAGVAHIFKVHFDGELEDSSLCGKSLQDIGEKTLERNARVVGLPVCVGCGEKWKQDPESEWGVWSQKVTA